MLLFFKTEGLPVTLIKAYLIGASVVCNYVSGNTEIIRDGENGFIVNRWEKLASRLNSLPTVLSEEYKRWSQRGREIYEQNFTFDKFKAKYLLMLKML